MRHEIPRRCFVVIRKKMGDKQVVGSRVQYRGKSREEDGTAGSNQMGKGVGMA
jgi:hypothetical protein